MNTLDQRTALEQAARKRIKDSMRSTATSIAWHAFIVNGQVPTSWMSAGMNTAGRRLLRNWRAR
ncbi:hypothetical protein P3C58_32780, partial [Mesorhizobium sp. XAP10]|uniref:hypothetical protein n=1 Tax=unclassified Mesorhizobium TaxID=325217 RepID=UPI0023DFB0AC